MASIPYDELISTSAVWRDGHGKNTAIARSTSATISTIASSLLIYIISRSSSRFSTTYHRILLCMSISDIFMSCGLITFNAAAPRDVDYMVWNARGSAATCTAFGLLVAMGFLGGLLYTCSLNINYLLMVRYNMSTSFIKQRIEPFLLGMPCFVAVVCCTIGLVGQNYNPNEEGECATEPLYNPPHCIGLEVGEIRDGFMIPCGRGSGWTASFYYIVMFVFFVGSPIVICVCLFMMFKSVRRLESRTSTYGIGSLNISATHPSEVGNSYNSDDPAGGSERSSVFRRASVMMHRRFASMRLNSSEHYSNSRSVLNRAMAYSFGYCLTWLWTIIYLALDVSGALAPAPPYPQWQIAFQYLTVIFSPLQGVFNFLIFMFPRVEKERLSSRGNISWCRAFGKAFNSSLGIQCNYRNRNSTPKSDTTDNNVVVTRHKTRSSDIVEEERPEAENSVEISTEEITTNNHTTMKGMTMLERRLSQGEEGLA